jgi:hypothetical protein
VVKKGDFEFDMELLISLMEAVVCCGTIRMTFIKTETKKAIEKDLYLSSRRLRALGNVPKTLLVGVAIIY